MAKLSAAQVRANLTRRCPVCWHGKNGGHNGRFCTKVVRIEICGGIDGYEYGDCGCRYDGRTALAEAEATK